MLYVCVERWAIVAMIGRPIFILVQGIVSIALLYWQLPFFRMRANCIVSGIYVGRILSAITGIIVIALNRNANDFVVGTSLAGATLLAYVIGLIVGFFSCEIYARIILKNVLYLVKAFLNSGEISPPVNLQWISIAIRFQWQNDEVRPEIEKFFIQLTNNGYESSRLCKIYAVQCLYWKRESPAVAMLYLRKALNQGPNFLVKFFIFLRFQEAELIVGAGDEARRIHKMLARVKSNEKKYYYFTKLYWRELLNSSDDWLRRDRFVFVGWSGLLLFPTSYLALGVGSQELHL
jgi:hypothetical protein